MTKSTAGPSRRPTLLKPNQYASRPSKPSEPDSSRVAKFEMAMLDKWQKNKRSQGPMGRGGVDEGFKAMPYVPGLVRPMDTCDCRARQRQDRHLQGAALGVLLLHFPLHLHFNGQALPLRRQLLHLDIQL